MEGSQKEKKGIRSTWKKMNLTTTKRWFKYKYLLLMRAKGGASIVARGFSIGLAIEMFTPPTLYLGTLLIFPITYIFRASLAGALAGFLVGKVIYLPFIFLMKRMGTLVLPKHYRHGLPQNLPHWLDEFLKVYFKLFIGGIIVGAILGLISYFPVKWLLQLYDIRRKEKRKKRKAQLLLNEPKDKE